MIGSSILVFSNLYQITKDLRNFRTSNRFLRMKITITAYAITIDNAVMTQFHNGVSILRIDLLIIVKTRTALVL